MSRHHDCPGETCPRCKDRIADLEFPEPDETAWQDAQDAYERDLDRLGGGVL